jgi:inosose dehydratase
MSKIKLGCETYTWQMPGEMYKGKLDHIMGVMSKAGFTGIEAETSFFVELADPVLMKETLDKHKLELAALCYVEDWLGPNESSQERERADQWIDFLTHFPDAIFLPVQMPGKDRQNLVKRQNNLISCVNAIAQRAADKGIECSYHPNSPEGSVFRSEQDYKILLSGLNPDHIGYTPDLGHIAKGGMDPLEIVKEYRSLVNMIHFKDMHSNGEWALTGEGVVDMKAVTQFLIDTDFEGWIIMEDECDRCITEPDEVTLEDGVYIEREIATML